jgi:hypothetical protein
VHARCALIAWDDAPELTGAKQLTLQKVLPLDHTTTYPVRVAFQGESPEEYPDAYVGGRKRKPYSLGAVNARLAKLGGRG